MFGQRGLVAAAYAGVMAAGALAAAGANGSPSGTTVAGCTMSIEPLNPFLQTCGIPNNPPVVRGASPGAGAIIACRNQPGCLSYVVNGGPGYGGLPRPDTRVNQSP